ncbi:CopM family metallochaperone [Brevundimonas goettingensis]|nr:DUF305 domain-containing protein [Brevundimonas goettingensis]
MLPLGDGDEDAELVERHIGSLRRSPVQAQGSFDGDERSERNFALAAGVNGVQDQAIMENRRMTLPLKLIALMAGSALAGAVLMAFAQAPRSPFDTEMTEAMLRMHTAMTIAPTGDSDRDFAAMMIPHHQGAVDMARIELAYGKDEPMRRLAQGIIVEQTQEIALMQDFLDRSATRPTSNAPASPHTGH